MFPSTAPSALWLYVLITKHLERPNCITSVTLTTEITQVWAQGMPFGAPARCEPGHTFACGWHQENGKQGPKHRVRVVHRSRLASMGSAMTHLVTEVCLGVLSAPLCREIGHSTMGKQRESRDKQESTTISDLKRVMWRKKKRPRGS